MGKAVNSVFLLGRLANDVELKSLPSGKSVASFAIAIDKQTADGADFFDCVAWDKTAELLSQYTHKGSRVHVQGRLQKQSWEKDGQKRSKIEVVVNDFTLLDSKSDSANQTQKDNVTEDVGDNPINLDDIPF